MRNKLKPEQGGSEGYLCQADAKSLISHLNERTYLYVKEICAYVAIVFKKTYSISGMTKWLRANGFRYKKPHGVPAKSDASKQEKFIEQYEELKKHCRLMKPYFLWIALIRRIKHDSPMAGFKKEYAKLKK